MVEIGMILVHQVGGVAGRWEGAGPRGREGWGYGGRVVWGMGEGRGL